MTSEKCMLYDDTFAMIKAPKEVSERKILRILMNPQDFLPQGESYQCK